MLGADEADRSPNLSLNSLPTIYKVSPESKKLYVRVKSNLRTVFLYVRISFSARCPLKWVKIRNKIFGSSVVERAMKLLSVQISCILINQLGYLINFTKLEFSKDTYS